MSPEHRQRLLELARVTMVQSLRDAPIKKSASWVDAPVSYGGLFVSLHHGASLRGCIGTFAPRETIEETVQAMSAATLRDPRFVSNPVTLPELPVLQIEISVLSVPEPTDDPLSLQVGRDGVIVERAGRSGCFLPQVAAQLGWSAERFLDECCVQKARLPAGAWREPATRVLLFRAESFADYPPIEHTEIGD